MRKRYSLVLLASITCIGSEAQILVDSIPLPGLSQGFWGIHVNPDTIFLGADFNGNVYCFDHDGAQLSTEPTGFDFNHGLIKQPGSHLIAEDYTTNGAHLYEVSHSGATLLNTWTFPDVIGGNSSGIGDICADGNAIWYTMYYPDFDVYPYAYAYKWVPGDPTASDTVPMQGNQPYGIALKGDTLFYVTDNLDGDAERIHAYDLSNEQDLGFVDVPDPDGDQSPRGMFYDGEYLYLLANRSGPTAFAYQTIFIYAFDASMGFTNAEQMTGPTVFPSPVSDQLHITGVSAGTVVRLHDAQGKLLRVITAKGPSLSVPVQDIDTGVCTIVCAFPDARRSARSVLIAH